MDFWKIVGIVLLVCAVTGLSVLFRELREKQKKMQKENTMLEKAKNPEVLPTEGKKREYAMEKQQSEKSSVPETADENMKKTVRKEETNLFLVLYNMIQQEQSKQR